MRFFPRIPKMKGKNKTERLANDVVLKAIIRQLKKECQKLIKLIDRLRPSRNKGEAKGVLRGL